MTKEEFDLRIISARKYLLSRDPDNPAYSLFFRHVRIKLCKGTPYIQPISFEKFRTDEKWGDISKSNDSISLLARRMDGHLNNPEFQYRGEVRIAQAAHFIYVIIGQEEIEKFEASQSQMKVGISLGDTDTSKDFCPQFHCGDPITLEIHPHHQKGWLYLFLIDSAQTIRALYPRRFGQPSAIRIPARKVYSYSDYRNEIDEIPWVYSGSPSGHERVFAILVDNPKSVTISSEYIHNTFSYPLLFAKREIPKGMPHEKGLRIEDAGIGADEISIGVVDYYYDANASS